MTNLNQLNVYLYRTEDGSKHDSDLFKRYILFKETGLKGIRFQYGSYGKPYLRLPGYTEVHFNISHSGHYLVGAVSIGYFIGIDIEWIKPIDFDCIDFFMSEKEIIQFNRIRLKEEKLDYFYTIWTLKEAYSKMLGMGLNMKLTEISIENQQIKPTLKDVFCYSMIVENLYRLSLICSRKMRINVVHIKDNIILEEFNHNQFI
ncbi:4'-phosphopantetheinyl transferase family protein [Bacillus sp. Hm123]|uniref:4'-phosphopantetheinyl transferase family protein n=1 Tax=Bacillus sp. Hm123 TaxID=3450745 RepID=UPI003F43CA9C